jgi:hypothetical protein
MNLGQISQWRSLIGRVGMVLGIILLAALIDAVIAKHSTSFNIINAMPGTTVEVTGPLAEKIDNIQELVFESSTAELTLSFEAAFLGTWFGDQMWRGQLTLNPHLPPGKYTFIVKLKKPLLSNPPLVFRVNVYPDPISLQQSSPSFIQRHLGISPWHLVAIALPFLVLAGAIIFLLSRQLEAQMAQNGQAEVYRVRKVESGYEISFSLGYKQGIQPGSSLTLYNENGQALATVEVQEVSPDDAVGLVQTSGDIKPGFIVSQS